eukprot:157258_1
MFMFLNNNKKHKYTKYQDANKDHNYTINEDDDGSESLSFLINYNDAQSDDNNEGVNSLPSACVEVPVGPQIWSPFPDPEIDVDDIKKKEIENKRQKNKKNKKYQTNKYKNDNNELPKGWTKRMTADGQIYYQNNILKTTQWKKPIKNKKNKKIKTDEKNNNKLPKKKEKLLTRMKKFVRGQTKNSKKRKGRNGIKYNKTSRDIDIRSMSDVLSGDENE